MKHINKKNKKSAFSLVEILAALVVAGVIGVGVVSLFNVGHTVAMRKMNLSAQLTAERFSVENVQSRLRRGLASVDVIKAADAKALDIPGDSSLMVIYREDEGPGEGHIFLRSRHGREALFTTDKMKELEFTLSVDVDINPAPGGVDYHTLRVRTAAGGILRDDAAARFANRDIALLGKPAKGGDDDLIDVTGENRTGDAIAFIPAFDGFEAFNLRILSGDTLPPESDKIDVAGTLRDGKGIDLIADYEIRFPEFSEGAGMDESLIEWYVTASPDVFSDARRLGHSTSAGRPGVGDDYEGDVLRTGLLDDQLLFEESDTAFVRYKILPRTRINGVLVTAAAPHWSDWTAFVPPGGAGLRFWRDFWDAALGGGVVRNDGVTIQEAGLKLTPAELNIAAGNAAVEFTMPSGSAGAGAENLLGVYMRLDERHFTDAVAYERAYATGGVAYANVANYSIIMDAKLLSVGGYALLLNADNRRVDISGYGVAYDSHSDLGGEDGNSSIHALRFDDSSLLKGLHGVERVEGEFFDTDPEFAAYHPKHMQNDEFKFSGPNSPDPNDPDADDHPWLQRHRIMYTVLEYADANDGDKIKFIVRAKFLKNLDLGTINDSRAAGDHFFIGEKYRLSEPIWFGDFVGSPYKVSGVDDNGTDVTSFNASFGGRPLNTAWTEEEDAKRDRYWVCLPLAGENNGTLTIYSTVLAPGFTQEELRAILPEGAKVLTPSLLYDNPTSNVDLNRILFGSGGKSDGTGNGGDFVGVNDL